MNKRCRLCLTNVPLSRWSAHMRHYHGGTSVRPFGMAIEDIESNVERYITLHQEEWNAARVKPTCSYCKGPCQTVTACRRRRDRERQIADMARRMEGK